MAKTPYSVVVTDLDGTVLQGDGTLSSSTVDAARELQRCGIPLIVATARTPAGVLAVEHLASLTKIAVCCTGALGWSFDTPNPLWTQHLAEDVVRRIAEILSRFDRLGLASFDARQWRMTSDYVGIRGVSPRGPSQVASLTAVAGSSACALAACISGLEASQIATELRTGGISEDEATLTWAAKELLDIAPPNVDKGIGVRKALDMLDMKWEEAIVFGDMPNDLPMLTSAATAVAVDNAHPDVLLAADLIANRVSYDGFERTLRHFGTIL
ncbi:MAG: HAD family hydrolase [Acidimicrobiales bacterium]